MNKYLFCAKHRPGSLPPTYTPANFEACPYCALRYTLWRSTVPSYFSPLLSAPCPRGGYSDYNLLSLAPSWIPLITAVGPISEADLLVWQTEQLRLNPEAGWNTILHGRTSIVLSHRQLRLAALEYWEEGTRTPPSGWWENQGP